MRKSVDEFAGRRVVMVKVGPDLRGGALDVDASSTLADAATLARSSRLPLIGVITTSGADVREGVAALHGWGQVAKVISGCSGVIPILVAVTGPMLAGPALLLGIADVVVLTADASVFMSGPGQVAAYTGQQVAADELGGALVTGRTSGLAAAVAATQEDAVDFLAAVLGHFPDHADEIPALIPTDDPVDRSLTNVHELLPLAPTGSYDVRALARAIVDDDDLLELWGGWAPNLVTGLASLGGRPIGVVANQPLALAGTLDIPASQKGARFVDLCDAFNLPILTLVDTPGFFPGRDLEWRGMIRHGAQLVGAYARATVPRICLVVRKAYGGAYIVMDSKDMGNDICLAWPTAELAVMGAKAAVEIVYRREPEDIQAEQERLYVERFMTPWVAAERGYVDAVIDPADTRRQIGRALHMLGSKRERLPRRRHDTLPL